MPLDYPKHSASFSFFLPLCLCLDNLKLPSIFYTWECPTIANLSLRNQFLCGRVPVLTLELPLHYEESHELLWLSCLVRGRGGFGRDLKGEASPEEERDSAPEGAGCLWRKERGQGEEEVGRKGMGRERRRAPWDDIQTLNSPTQHLWVIIDVVLQFPVWWIWGVHVLARTHVGKNHGFVFPLVLLNIFRNEDLLRDRGFD